MDDIPIVERVIGAFFGQRFGDSEKIRASYPSIPKYFLTEDFSDKAKFLLSAKGQIFAYRWSKLFDTCYRKMFSSHEKYLTFVIFACFRENACNHDVFESFVSVCALLYFISFQTHKKIGVDLYHLNCITMFYFYTNQLRNSIFRSGGCERLIEFIHDHRYHNYEFPEATVSLKNPVTDLKNQTEKEMLGECVKVEEIDVDKAENDEYSISMAQGILKYYTGLYELPDLPSYEDLVKILVTCKRRENYLNQLRNLYLQKHTGSNSNTKSKTNNAIKCQDNIEQYESIIQAVIRHNHTKCSGHDNANTKIQEEANGVLEHMKDTIEKLTKVLNEIDKD